MPTTKIEIHEIGAEALGVLQRNQTLETYGTSSRGIYLQPANDLTLFISTEEFQGPLTINISEDLSRLPKIKPGEMVSVKGKYLVFPVSRLEISFQEARIWSPAPPPEFGGLKKSLLGDMHQQSRVLAAENPFFPLLEMVFTSLAVPLPGFPDFYQRMKFLEKALQTGGASKLIWEIENLLGAGPGLTPLGDDLAIGVLLALNRGRGALFNDYHLKQINQAVIELALDKTTRLSFSLIVCAADGSADQRLLKVLDGMLSGQKSTNPELDQMLSWGNTSGIAVLGGMILALR